MSTLDTTMSGRRVAARNAAERRKKLLLVGLMVVFGVLLALQLPKLLKGSGSSSSTTAPSATATGTPAAVAGGTRTLAASTSTARRVRAIHRMSARDPFLPLIRESTTSSSASASTSAGTAVGSSTITFTGRAGTTHAKPVHAKPVGPIAAVIWTNGQRQVVGLSQVFKVGDAPFRLVGVTPKAMRIEVVGGKFAHAKQAISVRKGHRVKLVNTATGVAYRLLFMHGTTNAPSASIALASTTAGKN